VGDSPDFSVRFGRSMTSSGYCVIKKEMLNYICA